MEEVAVNKARKRILQIILFLISMPWKAWGSGLESRIDSVLQQLSQHGSMAPAEVDPVILRHPLFIPGRRPLEQNGDPRRRELHQPLGKTVLKAVIRERQRIYALISRGNHSLQAVLEGDLLDGARVVRILPDRLVLQRDGAQRTLRLYHYPPIRPGREDPSSSGHVRPATRAGGKEKPGGQP